MLAIDGCDASTADMSSRRADSRSSARFCGSSQASSISAYAQMCTSSWRRRGGFSLYMNRCDFIDGKISTVMRFLSGCGLLLTTCENVGRRPRRPDDENDSVVFRGEDRSVASDHDFVVSVQDLDVVCCVGESRLNSLVRGD